MLYINKVPSQLPREQRFIPKHSPLIPELNSIAPLRDHRVIEDRVRLQRRGILSMAKNRDYSAPG
jgi:hypothetical protein